MPLAVVGVEPIGQSAIASIGIVVFVVVRLKLSFAGDDVVELQNAAGGGGGVYEEILSQLLMLSSFVSEAS